LVEPGQLHVAGGEADVLEPGLGSLLNRQLDHPLRDVNPVGVAGAADYAGEPDGRVAEPAADVEHAVALAGRAGRQRRLPVVPQALGHDVAVLHPDVEQRAIPGLGRLEVVLDHPDRVRHDRRVYAPSSFRLSSVTL
jgi:hypothetical protein